MNAPDHKAFTQAAAQAAPLAARAPQRLHLALMQPPGRIEALGALDAAGRLQRQFEAIGVPVTLARQQLRADAVNLIIGAGWGFDADAALGHVCALVETDPRGAAAPLSAPHRRLQQRLAVLRPAGVPGAAPAALPGLAWPVIGGLPAAHESPGPAQDAALAARPIPLLMVQPLTARRARWVARIEAAGCRVARLDPGLVADERAALVRQARAVLLLRDGDDGCHDSLAAALALEAGTPVIADGSPAAWPEADSAGCVSWVDEPMLDEFFGVHWAHGAWLAQAQAALDATQRLDRTAALQGAWLALQQLAPLGGAAPTRVRRVQEGDAARRAAGWDDAAIVAGTAPQAEVTLWRVAEVQDVASPQALALCQRAFAHLAPGGTLVMTTTLPGPGIPEGRDASARARWLARQVQRLSWPGCGGLPFEHRLALTHCGWLDDENRPTAPAQARRARMVLTKVDTSYAERTLARSVHPGFGLFD